MPSTELPIVQGFRFAAVTAGLRKQPLPDLGAIVADEAVPTAALFTRNRVRAAPVLVAEARVARGPIRALLVNAGCANACTGAAGLRAARSTTAALAGALACPVRQVLPASTGVIGALLPEDRVVRALPRLLDALGADRAMAFARAICTTDRWPKVSHGTRRGITAVGIAKGAGMIHPDLATTLAFLVCDGRARRATLLKALRAAADATFNSISVDGDTSTNDTLVAMCSGQAPGRAARAELDAPTLTDLFIPILDDLARMIVADGEGSQHVVTVRVTGCPSARAARAVARTVATSPLVKTALHGKDPNWGRILAAAGRAGVPFRPDRAAISIGDVPIVAGGVAVGPDAEDRARVVMARERYEIRVDLGRGRASARYLTCDLGHAYIDVNASYRS